MTVDEDGANQPLTAPATLLRKGKASVDGQLSLQLATLHLMFRSEDGTQTEAKAPSSRHASVASADGNSTTTAAAALCLDILSLRDVRAGVKVSQLQAAGLTHHDTTNVHAQHSFAFLRWQPEPQLPLIAALFDPSLFYFYIYFFACRQDGARNLRAP